MTASLHLVFPPSHDDAALLSVGGGFVVVGQVNAFSGRARVPPAPGPRGGRMRGGDCQGGLKGPTPSHHSFIRWLLLLMGALAATSSEAAPTFSATNFAADDGPKTVGIADFDGDGINDIALTNTLSDTITAPKGDGSVAVTR